MSIMTWAAREDCGHESCAEDPCQWGTGLGITYVYDITWGWVSSCDLCEQDFPGELPRDHYLAQHEGV